MELVGVAAAKGRSDSGSSCVAVIVVGGEPGVRLAHEPVEVVLDLGEEPHLEFVVVSYLCGGLI